MGWGSSRRARLDALPRSWGSAGQRRTVDLGILPPDWLRCFAIAKTARVRGEPPRHRLYAKLVLRADGTKEYLQATPEDEDAYTAAGARLRELALPSPRVAIQTGYNTRQVLNYGYTRWDQFFNDRQLLGIGLLSRAIGDLPAGAERDALFVLLSGVLEFNNLFASYKGEGTGAVRHMFSHHVLKPSAPRSRPTSGAPASPRAPS